VKWTKVFSLVRQYPVDPIAIDREFLSPLLIIQADSIGKQKSLRRAGWILPVFEDVGVGESEGISRIVYFARKKIRFENLEVPFQLQFQAFGYIPDIILNIWEPDAIPVSLAAKNIEDRLARIEQKLDAQLNREFTVEVINE
jgi:hypothetical protein